MDNKDPQHELRISPLLIPPPPKPCAHQAYNTEKRTEMTNNYKDKFVVKGQGYTFNTKIKVERVTCIHCSMVQDRLLVLFNNPDMFVTTNSWLMIASQMLTSWTKPSTP